MQFSPSQFSFTPGLHTHAAAILKRITTLLVFVSLLTIGSFASADDASGDFIDKKYAITGDWSMTKRDGAWVISLSDSFNTKSGPDLKIFLSPQSISDVTGSTATQGSILVDVLKSNTGAQEYVLPANIDPAKFKSLLIHCEQYSVLWGGADYN